MAGSAGGRPVSEHWGAQLVLAAGGVVRWWVDELKCAEAGERPVHQEDLNGEVGLDVRLAEERENLAAGQLFNHFAIALYFHHPLEVAAHVKHSLWLAAFIIVRSIAVNPSVSTQTIRLSST